jgi:preprotein translocase subunit SecA
VYDFLKIKLYCRSDRKSDEIIVKPNVESGTVMISTNLGSRGTDYKITEEVKQSGGLFVIVSFMPYNERVEEQALGRTARQGTPGAAQIIVNRETLPLKLRTCKTLAEVREKRKQIDELKLKRIIKI